MQRIGRIQGKNASTFHQQQKQEDLLNLLQNRGHKYFFHYAPWLPIQDIDSEGIYRGSARLMSGNQLPTKIKEKALEKYNGREYLMDLKVPPLDCLWNDVVHNFLYPLGTYVQDLQKLGIKSGGAKIAEVLSQRPVLAVPLDKVDLVNGACIWLYNHFTPEKDNIVREQDFVSFHDPRMLKLVSSDYFQQLPKRAKQYFKEENERPFIAAHVPHFLIKVPSNGIGLEGVRVSGRINGQTYPIPG